MKNAQITKTAKATNAIAAMVKSAPVANKVAAENAAKPARAKRPAQKPVAKVESIVAKSAPVLAIKYTITAGRPAAGRPLKAFTQAVIELLGMKEGKAYDRTTLVAVMGGTAVSYHLRTSCAFLSTEKGVMLTPQFGADFFGMRTDMNEYDPKDVEDFKAILVHGKSDGRLVKNQAFIAPLK